MLRLLPNPPAQLSRQLKRPQVGEEVGREDDDEVVPLQTPQRQNPQTKLGEGDERVDGRSLGEGETLSRGGSRGLNFEVLELLPVGDGGLASRIRRAELGIAPRVGDGGGDDEMKVQE